jgi:tetrahydromethanopterin S-methyltransferase subunit F
VSIIAWLRQLSANNRRILFGMKAVRIAAIALGAVVALYVLVTVLLPQWMIVGIHFSLAVEQMRPTRFVAI